MNLLIVSASHRHASQSLKVARVVAAAAACLDRPFAAVEIVDLAQAGLPFWVEDDERPGSPRHTAETTAVCARVAGAEAFVFVVPEWNGMAPPQLTNLLILCNRHEFAHKPALLIGISNGMGGAYPLAGLRAASAKDTHICYIPEALVIRNVADRFAEDRGAETADLADRTRLDYTLCVLRAYADALAGIRRGGVIDLARYPYGV